MSDINKCAWKNVDPGKFVMGIEADRCGQVAQIKILRPYRKNDLYLCENHFNEFIQVWGLHNQVKLLCLNWIEGTRPQVSGYARATRQCEDPDCTQCLQDDPSTWSHQ